MKGKMKETKIGHVPCDWDVCRLSKVSAVKTGPFGAQLHAEDYVSDGTPIVTVEHLSEMGLIHANLPLVSDDDKNRLAQYCLVNGDIVFSRVGSVDRNSLVTEKEHGWLFSGRLLRARPKKSNVDPQFLSHYFNQETFKHRIRSVSVGGTMPSLNTQLLSNILISLPPLPEQKKITKILSTWDRVIDQTTKLIAQKHQLKKGLMQQLLTGKTRFPEFGPPAVEGKSGKKSKVGWISEDWDVLTGSELGEIRKGSGVSKSEVQASGLPAIRYGELYTSHHIVISEIVSYVNEETASKSTKITRGDILFAGSGETREEIGKSAVYLGDVDAYAGGDIIVLSPRDQNPTFLAYMFNAQRIQKDLFRFGQGHSVVHVYKATIAELTVPTPSIPEQEKIAEVLFACDNEINDLQRTVDQYREQKRGLMQQLLTGKKRVKVGNA